MPWKVKDVDSHKKGLTPAQKKKWVSIANGVLKDCQSKGGKDCEAKAIRIANSKFAELSGDGNSDIIHHKDCDKNNKKSEDGLMKEKLPKGALRFVDKGCHAVVEFSEKDDDVKKPKRLNMVGYSGGVIKDHWYWGDLAISLDGIKFKQKKYPILEDHDTSRKIAVMGKPSVENGRLETPENVKFLRTEAANEFLNLSEDGFPFQASIYAKPIKIRRLEEKEVAEVNGMKLKGPNATVWEECEFKEVSVCVFGWDSRTQASAFSKDEFETVHFTETSSGDVSGADQLEDTNIKLKENEKEVTESMDLEKLKSEHPDLFKAVLEMGKSEASAGDEKLNEVLSAVKASNERMDKIEESMSKLNENDTLRGEKELARDADKIWNEMLSQSENIPARLYSEIKQTVSHNRFVGEKGFDREGFTEAVKAKVDLWDENLKPEPDVNGFGNTDQDIDGQDASIAEENNQMVLRLRRAAGEKIEE
jgi:hypothetical protein